MNKKVKLLSSALCGAILASNLATISVQAKDAGTPKTNGDIHVRMIIPPKQQYTCVGKLSGTAITAVSRYFDSHATNASPTDVRNILIQNGVNRALAGNLAFSICDMQTETKYFSIALPIDKCDAEILQAPDGTYTLMQIESSNEPQQDYTFYGLLERKDLVLIRDFVKSGKSTSVNVLAQFLVDQNIVADSTVASKLAPNLFYYPPGALEMMVDMNQNFLVLQSNDGSYYRIALESK